MTSRLRSGLAATVLAATALLATPAAHAATAPAAPTYPVPAAPAGLPATVDPLAPYVPQDSCDPTNKPGTDKLAQLLTATYPDTSIIGESYVCGSDGGVSEHYEGRAIDWAIDRTSDKQEGEANALLAWLFGTDAQGVQAGNARRLGVMYAIFNKKIIGTYNLAAGWRAYSCVGVTACHEDHVHLSLSWNGAMGATTWWTGAVSPTDYGPCRTAGFSLAATVPGRTANPDPCPSVAAPGDLPGDAPAYADTLRAYSGASLAAGSAGPVVSALQSALGVKADGSFGPATTTALQAFQTAHGVPATGVADLPTWAALLAAAGSLPPAQTATVAKVAATPALPPTLHLGSRGISVKLVQSKLHVKPVSGTYGPLTGNAVRKFQRAHKLPVDGIVGPKTWKALGHWPKGA